MARFSIIIPIFNVEAYLKQAIDSVLKQSFRDFELVLVDDGSKDASPQICDEYQEADSRVVVLHKKNGGAAAARNDGIRMATGEYVTFMDSDDYWDDPEALGKMDAKLSETDADVLETRLKAFNCQTGKVQYAKQFPPELLKELSTPEALRTLISTATYQVSAGLKVIRRAFLMEHALFFPEGVTCEDILWGIRISAAYPRYAFMNLYFYCYREGRPGSVTSNIREKNIQDYLYILTQSYEAVEQADSALGESLRGYLLYQTMIALALVQNLSVEKSIRADYFAQLRRLCGADLRKPALHPKAKKALLIYKLFGFRAMAFVLGRYLSVR